MIFWSGTNLYLKNITASNLEYNLLLKGVEEEGYKKWVIKLYPGNILMKYVKFIHIDIIIMHRSLEKYICNSKLAISLQ